MSSVDRQAGLHDYGIDIEPGAYGEVRAICPECSHTRVKSREKCLSVNVDKGTWICHHCEWSGGLGVKAQINHRATTKGTKPASNTKAYALRLWLKANHSTVTSHPYAINKGIETSGGAARVTASGSVIGRDADCLLIPIRDIETEKVVGVQAINPEGKKQTFGAVSGNGLLLGNTLDKKLIWYICEGWASAYSMVFHHQKGNGVCAASFGKSNQDKLAQKIADVHNPDEIIILREVD